MSRTTQNTVSRRATLFATSIFASAAMIAAGGVGNAVLTPGVAIAGPPPACTPTANGNTGPGSATAAVSVQNCTPDTGIAYVATGGDLSVQIVGVGGTTLSPNGVYITDDTHARNLTLDVVTTTSPGGTIVDSSGNDGIFLDSTGGNVFVGTGSAALGSFAGAAVTSTGGAGIYAETTGAGTVGVNATNTVTGEAGAGIAASTGTGNITITTGAPTTTSAVNPVAITGSSTGVDAYGGGNVSITTNGNVTGQNIDGIYAEGAKGNVAITANGNVAGGTTFGFSTGIRVEGVTGTGTIGVTANGNVSGTRGVDITTGSTGDVTFVGNGTITGVTGVGLGITGAGGNVTATTNGAVSGDWAVNLSNTGTGTLTYNANANVTGTNGGIDLTTQGGANTLNIGGNVTVANTGGANAAVHMNSSGLGAGPIVITAANGSDIESVSDGVHVSSDGGAITIGNATNPFEATIGNTTPVLGYGIHAVNYSFPSTSDINIDVGGNISSANTGIFALNIGNGNISVTTEKGQNISSTFGDGIDAFANGGNVLVTLLDGSITSNASGQGPTGLHISGYVGPSYPFGASHGSMDPNGVWAQTNGFGTVTVIADDNVSNTGPGQGILAQAVDGNVTVIIGNATAKPTIQNSGGNGIEAVTTGAGDVLVTTVAGSTVTTSSAGAGINVNNGGTGTGNLTVNAAGNVSSGGGDGIDAEDHRQHRQPRQYQRHRRQRQRHRHRHQRHHRGHRQRHRDHPGRDHHRHQQRRRHPRAHLQRQRRQHQHRRRGQHRQCDRAGGPRRHLGQGRGQQHLPRRGRRQRQHLRQRLRHPRRERRHGRRGGRLRPFRQRQHHPGVGR